MSHEHDPPSFARPGLRPGVEASSGADASDPAIGRRVGPFLIGDVLGRGGMGVVYRARDERLGREVALKTIAGFTDEDGLRRFAAEARSIARLAHPGIVRVFEVGTWDGVFAMALELIAGESLKARLDRDGPMPPREAAALVAAIAEAVAHAHEAGVVHRDLKPENVLIGPDGTPRLTDFGLARDLAASLGTKTGASLGTPSYMAPEQALGGQGCDAPAVDIYGIGAILYETLTGAPPFHGGGAMAVLQRVVTDEPESPDLVRARRGLPPVPPGLERVRRAAMARRPEERSVSAAVVAEALRRVAAGRPSGRLPVRRSSTRVRAGVSSRAPADGAPRSVGLIAGAAGVLAIVTIGVAVGVALSAAPDGEAGPTASTGTPGATDGDSTTSPDDAAAVGASTTPADALEAALEPADDEAAIVALVVAARGDDRIGAAFVERIEAAARELRRVVDSAAAEASTSAPSIGDDLGALDAWIRPPGGPLADPTPEQPRAARVLEAIRIADATAMKVLGARQATELGSARLREIRLIGRCFERLVRRGDPAPDGARQALAEVLFAEQDPDRAIEIARSLARVDDRPETAALIHARARRFTRTNRFVATVGDEVLAAMRTDGDPTTGAGWLGLGMIHLRAKRARAAIAAFDRGIALDEDAVAELFHQRGIARVLTREHAAAAADLQRAAELAGDDALAWANLATLLGSANVSAARAAAMRAVETDPLTIEGWTKRGKLRVDAGDLTGALADLERAVQLDPEDAGARLGRAYLRVRTGDRAGAALDVARGLELAPDNAELIGLRRMLDADPERDGWGIDPVEALRNHAGERWSAGDFDGATRSLEKLVAARPDDGAAWSNLGAVRFQAGDTDGALAALERARALLGETSTILAIRGAIHIQRGDLERALADLERAVSIDARNETAWLNLATALLRVERLPEAIDAFDRAIALSPQNADHWLQRGLARERARDEPGARADLERAVALGLDARSTEIARAALGRVGGTAVPGGQETLDIDARNRRAIARWQAGDVEGARADLEVVVRARPGDEVAWSNLAGARLSLGDRRGAIEACDRALALVPTPPAGTLNVRGTARIGLRDLEGAIADLERAVEVDPRHFSAWANLGSARLQSSDAEGALAAYDRAAELDATDVFTMFGRGTAHARLGQTEAAIADLERALALNPDPKTAEEVRAELARVRAGDERR